jgi:hypothetical protein
VSSPTCRDMSATFPAKSPATFVIVAIASAALFVTALITGYGIPLFLVTRHRACVHRPPSTLPLLVDCCLFTPAVAAAVITVAIAVPSATTMIAITAASIVTDVVINATSINTAAAATVAAAAIAAAAAIVADGSIIAVFTNDGRRRRRRRRRRHQRCSPPLQSSTPSNAAADATVAIEPHLHCPPPPPFTAQHYSLPCWEYILPVVATYMNFT